MRYRLIDHTGDVGVKVYGKSPAELFSNAAYAFFDIVTDAKRIETRLEETISVSATDTEQLLVSWLSEFLYLFDTRRLVFNEFEVRECTPRRIEALARGEILEPARLPVKTEIKAVTYHGLKIEKKKNVYSTVIIFDL